jgi:hypothetical protein
MYVQRGSRFCFVVVVVVLGADTLLKILHYCPISPCFQHIAPLHAPLHGSLARQPCPEVLPGSLARQSFPAVLPGSLVRQSCPAVLPGSLARQSCLAVLPGSLAQQSCPAVFSTWSDLFRLVQTCLCSFRLLWLYPAFLRLVVNLKQISCPSTRVRTDLFSLVFLNLIF